jgi:hypothetical protein
MGFRTSTNGQTRYGFQDLDRQTDRIWVSGPRQTDGDLGFKTLTDRRNLGFRTSTDRQTGSGFQDLDRQTHRLTELIYMITLEPCALNVEFQHLVLVTTFHTTI